MNILLVKLGALGDVLRTTTVLRGLKKKYPAAHVSWVVEQKNAEALIGNLLLDEALVLERDGESVKKRRFDVAINLDKEKPALDLIMSVEAKKKIGFGRQSSGDLCALNPLSDYAYRLGIDDNLKFRTNQKTYQTISFEQLGLAFDKEEYVFQPTPPDREWAARHLESLNIRRGPGERPIIGLNTGAGVRFAGKILPAESFVLLAKKFHAELGANVLLLGGEDELDRNREISRLAEGTAVNTGSHSLSRFASIVGSCDVVVSGDTTAMHVAIAMKIPVVVYFASTCSAEIELYGRGEKIVSRIHCSPCYKKVCPIDEQCMKEMSLKEIFNATERLLPK